MESRSAHYWSKQQYTQQDLGIYQILNETSAPLNIGNLRYTPFYYYPVPLADHDYRGSDQYLVGVSNTIVQPGQYEYVALCSSNQNSSPAMMLVYNFGESGEGVISFTAAGQVDDYSSNVSYNEAQQLFTIY